MTQRYVSVRHGCDQPQPGRPTVEEMRERYAALGIVGHDGGQRRAWATYKPPLTAAERAQIDRLRPTHTLAELAEMFHRHPATIRNSCRLKVDLRSRRRRIAC